MNIQAYIESGILENYVLGLLSENEAQEVATNVLKYPQLKTEKELIEDTLFNYCLSYKKKVPVNLEPAILAKINEQNKITQTKNEEEEVITFTSITQSLLIGFLIVSSLLLGYLAFENHTKNNEINSIKESYQALKSDCETKDQSNYKLQEELKIFRFENNIQVKMKGTDKAPQAIANIIYNATKRVTYLDVLSLPKPPSDKQYQLWAIIDGKPVDMGVFDIVLDPSTNLQKVPFLKNPQAFAVTLEQKGGSPTPTLEEMYVIGYTTG